MKKIYCLVEDDYLRAATDNPAGSKAYGGFWMLDEDESTRLVVVTALVDDLAAKAFIAQGTSDQVFSDGYDAFRKLVIENKEKPK